MCIEASRCGSKEGFNLICSNVDAGDAVHILVPVERDRLACIVPNEHEFYALQIHHLSLHRLAYCEVVSDRRRNRG